MVTTNTRPSAIVGPARMGPETLRRQSTPPVSPFSAITSAKPVVAMSHPLS